MSEQEVAVLLRRFEELRELGSIIERELENVRTLIADLEVLKNELNSLKEERDSLIPLGSIAYVKAKVFPKILVPLGYGGSKYYIALPPEEVKPKLDELISNLKTKEIELQKRLEDILNEMSAIEKEVRKLTEGAKSARQTQEGTEKSGK